MEATQNWLEFLETTAKSYWGNGERVLLLTQAAGHMSDAGLNYRAQTGGVGLKAAIVNSGTDQIRLIRDPDDELVWGVVPGNVVGDGAQIFRKFNALKAEHQRSQIRYRPSIWAAFLKVISPGHRRYFRDSTLVQFDDIASFDAEAKEDSRLEVDGKYLISDPKSFRAPADIEKNIREWAHERSIEIDSLEAPESKPRGNSPLDEFAKRLLSLDAVDLARISIHADIVAKVLKSSD